MISGLKADSLFVNWYNPRVRDLVGAARSPADFERILSGEKVRFIVVEDSFRKGLLLAGLNMLCVEVARVKNLTLYKYPRN